jgi:hypothetical protein
VDWERCGIEARLVGYGPNLRPVWARPDATEKVDVLLIDEAAQMSLANVLAVSQAARSIVLLGDPRQLERPMQSSHPEGTNVSALDHVLGERATIPADRGLLLADTWRRGDLRFHVGDVLQGALAKAFRTQQFNASCLPSNSIPRAVGS